MFPVSIMTIETIAEYLQYLFLENLRLPSHRSPKEDKQCGQVSKWGRKGSVLPCIEAIKW